MNSVASKYSPKKSKVLRNLSLLHTNKVYVFGYGFVEKQVEECLESLPYQIIHYSNVQNLDKKVSPDAKAIVLALPALDPLNKVKSVLESNWIQDIPVHVVTNNLVSDYEIMLLYKQGVCSVSRFPNDKKIFAKMFNFLQKNEYYHKNNDSTLNEGLNNTIACRLKAKFGPLKNFKTWYELGEAYIKGKVSTPKMKTKVIQALKDTPGVLLVHNENLEIDSYSRKSDDELENRIHDFITADVDLDIETIAASVFDGKVMLTGTVKSKRLLNKLKTCVASMDGVKQLNAFVSVSKHGYLKDKALATSIYQNLKSFFMKSDVKITVVNRLAVLHGRVKNISKKKLIEDYVLKHSSIQKVVNHIAVI